jgi:hypothetical protein
MTLRCEMRTSCERPVTHLDEKGYIYCEVHGHDRQSWLRCRRLTAGELLRLEAGLTVRRF